MMREKGGIGREFHSLFLGWNSHRVMMNFHLKKENEFDCLNDFLMILSTAKHQKHGPEKERKKNSFYYVHRKFLIIRSRHDALKYNFLLLVALFNAAEKKNLSINMKMEKKNV
jgi:hypothetical protein